MVKVLGQRTAARGRCSGQRGLSLARLRTCTRVTLSEWRSRLSARLLKQFSPGAQRGRSVLRHLRFAEHARHLPIANVAVRGEGKGPRRHAWVLNQALQGAGLEAGGPSPVP